ncbi:MAG: hypothetical protein K2X48_03160 [Chitinophagaceae bacterium]|nr:hypothetical protein [Chitinophagaceae bacterium]
MPLFAIIVIVLIAVAVVAKVSIVHIYYRKLKGDKDAKARVSFQSVFGGFISLNIQRFLLVKELPPFPESYSTYLKYQQRIQRLNRFILFCLLVLVLYAGYKIVMSEMGGEV